MDLEHPLGNPSEEENLNLNLGLQRPEILHLRDDILAHMNSTQMVYLPSNLLSTEEKSETNRAKLA